MPTSQFVENLHVKILRGNLAEALEMCNHLNIEGDQEGKVTCAKLAIKKGYANVVQELLKYIELNYDLTDSILSYIKKGVPIKEEDDDSMDTAGEDSSRTLSIEPQDAVEMYFACKTYLCDFLQSFEFEYKEEHFELYDKMLSIGQWTLDACDEELGVQGSYVSSLKIAAGVADNVDLADIMAGNEIKRDYTNLFQKKNFKKERYDDGMQDVVPNDEEFLLSEPDDSDNEGSGADSDAIDNRTDDEDWHDPYNAFAKFVDRCLVIK